MEATNVRFVERFPQGRIQGKHRTCRTILKHTWRASHFPVLFARGHSGLEIHYLVISHKLISKILAGPETLYHVIDLNTTGIIKDQLMISYFRYRNAMNVNKTRYHKNLVLFLVSTVMATILWLESKLDWPDQLHIVCWVFKSSSKLQQQQCNHLI